MSRCIDRAIGDMLYDYELDILDDQDTDLFETHLLECTHCRELLAEHEEVSELLRKDDEIRNLITELGQEPETVEETDPAAGVSELEQELLTTADPEPVASITELEQEPPTSVEPEPVARAPKSRLRSLWRPLAIAAGLVALLILRPWDLQFQPSQEAVASDRLLLVAPFNNLVDATDSNRTAMIASDLIATNLAESRFLRVVSNQTVNDLTNALTSGGADSGDSMAVPLKVARAARATYLLTGNIVQLYPALLLTTQVIDVATGEMMMSHRVVADSASSIFDVIDDLTAKIGNDLLVPLGFNDQYNPAVAEVTTNSAQAYRYYLEGREYSRRQYGEEARRSFERALEFDSTFAMCYYHLARSHDRTLIAQAVHYAEQASHRERLHIMSLDALFRGEFLEAEDILRKLVGDYPEDVMGWTTLAQVAKWQGQSRAAIVLLEEAISLNPAHERAINSLAYIYQEIGDTERAVATVDVYIAMVPGEPNPYDSKGDILSQSGRLNDAIESYQMVRSIKPDFDDYGTALELGQLYKYRGDYELARECFQDAATNGGSSGRSSARTNLALLPLYRGQLDEGWRVLEDGMGADRLDQACAAGHGPGQKNYFVDGMVHLALGASEKASEQLAKVIEIVRDDNPNDSIAYQALYAMALASAGHNEAADSILDLLERHRDDNEPSNDVFHIGRGFVSCSRGDFANAINELDQLAGKDDRKAFSIGFWAGRAYLETGRYREAADEFKAILDDYADPFRILMVIWDAQTHFYLAQSYEASERPDEATQQYEIFAELWKNADSVLQPMVQEANQRLAILRQGVQ